MEGLIHGGAYFRNFTVLAYNKSALCRSASLAFSFVCSQFCTYCIELFRKRLSEKVHATIPKGIVGGFWFTVFSEKFQRMAREAMDICLPILKESNKSRFDSNSVKNSLLNISHITFRDCCVHSFSDNLSRNSCIVLPNFLLAYAVHSFS